MSYIPSITSPSFPKSISCPENTPRQHHPSPFRVKIRNISKKCLLPTQIFVSQIVFVWRLMSFLSLLISHLEWTESEVMVSCQNVNKIAFHFIASLTLLQKFHLLLIACKITAHSPTYEKKRTNRYISPNWITLP